MFFNPFVYISLVAVSVLLFSEFLTLFSWRKMILVHAVFKRIWQYRFMSFSPFQHFTEKRDIERTQLIWKHEVSAYKYVYISSLYQLIPKGCAFLQVILWSTGLQLHLLISEISNLSILLYYSALSMGMAKVLRLEV